LPVKNHSSEIFFANYVPKLHAFVFAACYKRFLPLGGGIARNVGVADGLAASVKINSQLAVGKRNHAASL
jgi:hypothetical protein